MLLVLRGTRAAAGPKADACAETEVSRTRKPSDLLLASSEAGRAFRPSVVATAESRALVSFRRVHA
jgi:hypothetical protein